MFQGFVQLGDTLRLYALVTTTAGVPINADALPTYRVYGPDGLVSTQTGSMAKTDAGTVTGATNASPIVITSVAHGLSTGTVITLSGVGGNTAANGTFTVTYVSADTFSLQGSTGNGSYTSGGSWNTTGLYSVDLACTAINGYDSSSSFEVLVSGAISAVAFAQLITFIVT